MDKKKLLIVEDEPVLNKALQDFMTAEGFEVVTAIDGEEGIRKAQSEMPDLILLDIILPKKDGYEVQEYSYHLVDQSRKHQRCGKSFGIGSYHLSG